MRKLKKFLLNGALLAVTALIMRFVGVAFNVFLTNRLGAAGMGLITLILSVYGFAITFATSGINLSATRLCAEALGRESDAEVRVAMKKCIYYSLFFGVTGAVVLFCLAEPIGTRLLVDERTVSSLRILALSLPPISLASALNGYFTAMRRVYKNATSVFFGQFLKIAATSAGLYILLPKGMEYACIAVIGGSSLSEIVTFLYLWILYRVDLKHHNTKKGTVMSGVNSRLLKIGLPVAFSAYVRSGLITIEHLLIPRGLRKSGSSYQGALATYGIIHAMALPVVLFPSAVLSSYAGLLVPELSEAMAKDDRITIERIVTKVMRLTLIFSLGVSAIMFRFAGDLGSVIYSNMDAGRYILIFAPLIPVMYFDTATDAMLKGLGEQVYSMRVNILDAAVSVVLVYILIPQIGINGYIVMVFVTEVMNAWLSVRRLIQKTKVRLNIFSTVCLPLFCATGASSAANILFRLFNLSSAQSGMFLTLEIILALILYFALLMGTACVKRKELKNFTKLFAN